MLTGQLRNSGASHFLGFDSIPSQVLRIFTHQPSRVTNKYTSPMQMFIHWENQELFLENVNSFRPRCEILPDFCSNCFAVTGCRSHDILYSSVAERWEDMNAFSIQVIPTSIIIECFTLAVWVNSSFQILEIKVDDRVIQVGHGPQTQQVMFNYGDSLISDDCFLRIRCARDGFHLASWNVTNAKMEINAVDDGRLVYGSFGAHV